LATDATGAGAEEGIKAAAAAEAAGTNGAADTPRIAATTDASVDSR
jgi:hypothetical protein